jgi:hypothetical protein
MAIIDVAYFDSGLTNIPNTDQPSVSEAVNDAIAIYEPEYLKGVLGYELQKAFEAGAAELTPDQRWIDLLDGVEFTRDGVMDKWIGFNNVQFDSSIAYYVMFHFVRNNDSIFTGIGERKSKSVNSDPISSSAMLMNVWNKMVSLNEILYWFLNNNPDYPEFDGRVTALLYKRFSPFGTTI